MLVRYNELGLKSPRVRKRFQNQMIRNIEDKFLAAGLDCFIEFDWGRIYVQTSNLEKGIRILRSVFGITSISPVMISNDSINSISETVLKLADDLIKRGHSFALRTRRTGQHKYTSIELAEQLGKLILEKNRDKKIRVDLTKPDIELFIEVRNKRSYIFSQSFTGPGGLPLGTQGKILGIFSDDHSYVAAWLMMKRGCRVYPVAFFNEKIDISNGPLYIIVPFDVMNGKYTCWI